MFKTKRKSGMRSNRYGLEVVEAAIAMPVLVIVTFMTIDICNVIHLKQVANTVAFEAVREASKKDSTWESARAVGDEVAQARRLSNYRLTVEPLNSSWRHDRSQMNVGHTLRAYVDVPVRGNVAGGPFFLFQNHVVRSQLVRMSAQ